jgi:hypothetical protein
MGVNADDYEERRRGPHEGSGTAKMVGEKIAEFNDSFERACDSLGRMISSEEGMTRAVGLLLKAEVEDKNCYGEFFKQADAMARRTNDHKTAAGLIPFFQAEIAHLDHNHRYVRANLEVVEELAKLIPTEGRIRLLCDLARAVPEPTAQEAGSGLKDIYSLAMHPEVVLKSIASIAGQGQMEERLDVLRNLRERLKEGMTLPVRKALTYGSAHDLCDICREGEQHDVSDVALDIRVALTQDTSRRDALLDLGLAACDAASDDYQVSTTGRTANIAQSCAKRLEDPKDKRQVCKGLIDAASRLPHYEFPSDETGVQDSRSASLIEPAFYTIWSDPERMSAQDRQLCADLAVDALKVLPRFHYSWRATHHCIGAVMEELLADPKKRGRRAGIIDKEGILKLLKAMPTAICGQYETRRALGTACSNGLMRLGQDRADGLKAIEEGICDDTVVIGSYKGNPSGLISPRLETYSTIADSTRVDSIRLDCAKQLVIELMNPIEFDGGYAVTCLTSIGRRLCERAHREIPAADEAGLSREASEFFELMDAYRSHPIGDLRDRVQMVVTHIKDQLKESPQTVDAINKKLKGTPKDPDDSDRLEAIGQVCARTKVALSRSGLSWIGQLADSIKDPHNREAAIGHIDRLRNFVKKPREMLRLDAIHARLLDPQRLDAMIRENFNRVTASEPGSRDFSQALTTLGMCVPYSRNESLVQQVADSRQRIIKEATSKGELDDESVYCITAMLRATSHLGLPHEVVSAFDGTKMPYNESTLGLLRHVAQATNTAITPGVIPSDCKLDDDSYLFSEEGKEDRETVRRALDETAKLGIITEERTGDDWPRTSIYRVGIKDPWYMVPDEFHGRSWSSTHALPQAGKTQTYARVVKASGTYFPREPSEALPDADKISFVFRPGENEIRVHTFWGGDLQDLNDMQMANALHLRRTFRQLYESDDPHIKTAVDEFNGFPKTEEGVEPDVFYVPFGQFKPINIPMRAPGQSIGKTLQVGHQEGLRLAGIPDDLIQGHRMLGYIVPAAERVGELGDIREYSQGWRNIFHYWGYDLRQREGTLPRVLKDGQEVPYKEAAADIFIKTFPVRWGAANYVMHHALGGTFSMDYGSAYQMGGHNCGLSIHDLDTTVLPHQYDLLRNGRAPLVDADGKVITPGVKPTLSHSMSYYQNEDDKQAMIHMRDMARQMQIPEIIPRAYEVFRRINPEIKPVDDNQVIAA